LHTIVPDNFTVPLSVAETSDGEYPDPFGLKSSSEDSSELVYLSLIFREVKSYSLLAAIFSWHRPVSH
jgi:hypothetical protein